MASTRVPSESSGGSKLRELQTGTDACLVPYDDGSACGETGSFAILEELHKHYADRLEKIEDEGGDVNDKQELKIETMSSWIKTLNQINDELMQAIVLLEKEAVDRVGLLQDRLQKTNLAAEDFMSKIEDYDSQMQQVTGEKVDSQSAEMSARNTLSLAAQNEEALRTRITRLQNDIGNLLEVIRRARTGLEWNTDGLVFYEIKYEDIFGSFQQSRSLVPGQQPKVPEDKDSIIIALKDTQCSLQLIQASLEKDVSQKDKKIAALEGNIGDLKLTIVMKDGQIQKFINKIKEMKAHIQKKSSNAGPMKERKSTEDTVVESRAFPSASVNAGPMKERKPIEDAVAESHAFPSASVNVSVEEKRFGLEAELWKDRSNASEVELIKTRSTLWRLQEDLSTQQETITSLTKKLQDIDTHLTITVKDKQLLSEELAITRAALLQKDQEVDGLIKRLAETDKVMKDMRGALTAEVAEKHDKMQALRQEITELEEKLHSATMQTHFKDTIIKEMRKDLKMAKVKLSAFGLFIPDNYLDGCTSVDHDRHTPDKSKPPADNIEHLSEHRRDSPPTRSRARPPKVHTLPSTPVPEGGDFVQVGGLLRKRTSAAKHKP